MLILCSEMQGDRSDHIPASERFGLEVSIDATPLLSRGSHVYIHSKVISGGGQTAPTVVLGASIRNMQQAFRECRSANFISAPVDDPDGTSAVSYTHLTLPTKRIV